MTDPVVKIAQVPTVDFSPFMKEEGVVIGAAPTAAQRHVAQQIDAACRGATAFVHLVDFGLTTALRTAALNASAQLFALSDKESKLSRIDPSTNRGYSPLLSENINRAARKDPERKEAFNVRFPLESNDFTGCPLEFQRVVNELQQVLKVAARRYGLACALALGLPETFFSESLQKMSLCTIRFLHYPAYPDFNPAEELPARIGEHTDFGIFTFLLLGDNGAEGLQIKPVMGGDTEDKDNDGWLNVQVPSCGTWSSDTAGAIVNTGALMARWTNDEWRATAHRVLIQNELLASRSRYSIAFFVDPDPEHLVTVHDKFTHGGTVAKRYAPIKSSDYLLMKLQSMMGKAA